MAKERLRIGEVAEQAGVNLATLRYYERRGILREPERGNTSGYREYPSETVRLIRFIKRAQDLGFTLAEVEELLDLRRFRANERPRVREIAVAKLKDIEQKIRRLEAMGSALSGLLDECACKGSSLSCPILESLEDEPASEKKNARQ